MKIGWPPAPVWKALFVILGLVAFGAGVASFFYYPTKISDATYISENALLAGHSEPTFADTGGGQVVLDISAEYTDFALQVCTDFELSTAQRSRALAEWIAKRLVSFGTKAYIQTFPTASGETGYNAYGILPSLRGDGTESLVISTRYMTCNGTQPYSISGVASALGVIRHLDSRRWRHKDFIVVFTDGRHGSEGIEAWLKEYHNPDLVGGSTDSRPSNATDGSDFYTEFRRAGQIMGAMNLESDADNFDKILVLPEGTNGQLPNMDLVVATMLYIRRLGMTTKLSRNIIDTLLPQFLSERLTNDMATLFNFMTTLAVGLPSGDHGVFIQYYIDAVTVRSLKDRADYHFHTTMAATRYASVVEATMRSLNSITERLHQSYYYYLLCNTERYIPIGYYTPSLALILLPLILRGIYLYYFAPKERFWVRAFAEYLTIYGICGVIFLLPGVLQSLIPDIHNVVLIWLAAAGLLAVLTLVAVLPVVDMFVNEPAHAPRDTQGKVIRDRAALVAVASTGLMLFLGPYTILNFSFCVAVSLLVVPQASILFHSRSSILNALQALVVLVFSPPVLVLLFSLFLGIGYVDLWSTVFQHYLHYQTLTYPFLCLGLLPHNLAFWYQLLAPNI